MTKLFTPLIHTYVELEHFQFVLEIDDDFCKDGIKHNDICCDNSCGVCGGPGCGDLPGGL